MPLGKLCLQNMHVKHFRLYLYTQSLSLADKNDKVTAVEYDFCVVILYRIHLNILPIVVISNLCILPFIIRCLCICTSK